MKLCFVCSAGKTWNFGLKFLTLTREGSNSHPKGTDDSKILAGCPGQGHVCVSGRHLLLKWECETRHSVRLELIKVLTYVRRTQFELVIIFKLKKNKNDTHRAHATASCLHRFLKIWFKKKWQNSLYIPGTVIVFTFEIKSAIYTANRMLLF